MAATIFRYDNAGNALGILPYDSATHDEALDGTDKLTVVSEVSPTKRDRLVWQDDGGFWHEHMVDSTKRKHGANGARTESTCSNSINELYGVIAPGTTIRGRVDEILMQILAFTQWSTYGTENFGVVQIELYHKSVRECLAEMCELVHGELDTYITVDNSGVTRRYLRIVRERGNKSVMRQFQYGRNVSSIMREVAADEVYTAVKGFGAKLSELDTSEYPNRLEVVVNSNMDLSRWGVSKGDGTFAHSYTTYTDAQCTDKTFLMKQCKSVLDSVSKPLVRYEFDTADVGGLWSDMRLGDRVICIDELFNPPLELIERVSQIRRNLKGRVQCRIAIGARPNPLIDQFKAAEKTSKKSTGNSSRISSRTPTTTRGAGYDGESAAGIGDPVIPTGDEPTRIAVTTPPSKTTYYEGEKIDYSGIVVTLYNSDGSVYTDDWHPDGLAVFEELMFPVEIAKADKSVIPDYQTSGTVDITSTSSLSNAIDYAVARFPTDINGSGLEQLKSLVSQYENSPAMVEWFLSPDTFSGWSPLTVKIVKNVSIGETANLDSTYTIAEYQTRGERKNHGGAMEIKEAAFVRNFTGRFYVGTAEIAQGNTMGVSTVNATLDAENPGKIPVLWNDPNSDRQLTDGFEIDVEIRKWKGESWGGGEGINKPASSGGGTF